MAAAAQESLQVLQFQARIPAGGRNGRSRIKDKLEKKSDNVDYKKNQKQWHESGEQQKATWEKAGWGKDKAKQQQQYDKKQYYGREGYGKSSDAIFASSSAAPNSHKWW